MTMKQHCTISGQTMVNAMSISSVICVKTLRETRHKWSEHMKELFCEMNRERKKLTARTQYAKKDEKALLNRLEKYMHNHLLFLYDF